MVSPLEQNHPPAFFVSGPSPFAKLIIFAAFSIAVMAIDARMQYLSKIRVGFIGLITPLQIISNAPSVFYQSITKQLVTRENLMKEVESLQQQAMQYSMMLQRYQSLEIENIHLRKLLLTAQTGIFPTKLAEIVHMGRDPFVHKVIVNLGSENQIVPGQAVIDDKGVIGQVTNVFANSSEVTLIVDKSLSIPIQIQRNGLRAIAFGHGRDYTLELPNLPANVDIMKDDVLITSGIDDIYPEGLVVAKIVSITHQQDSQFANIVATPVAGVMNHKQVLLLNIPKVVEISPKKNHEISKSYLDNSQKVTKKPTQNLMENSAIKNKVIVDSPNINNKASKQTGGMISKSYNMTKPQSTQKPDHAPR